MPFILLQQLVFMTSPFKIIQVILNTEVYKNVYISHFQYCLVPGIM